MPALHSRSPSHSNSFKCTFHTVHFKEKITRCLWCLTHQDSNFLIFFFSFLSESSRPRPTSQECLNTLSSRRAWIVQYLKTPSEICTLSGAQSFKDAENETHIFRQKWPGMLPQTMWHTHNYHRTSIVHEFISEVSKLLLLFMDGFEEATVFIYEYVVMSAYKFKYMYLEMTYWLKNTHTQSIASTQHSQAPPHKRFICRLFMWGTAW